MTFATRLCTALLVVVFVSTQEGLADWPCRADSSIPIVTQAGHQWNPRIVSDGRYGSIIIWQDRRAGTEDKLYIQRIDGAGNPLWQSGGVLLSQTPGFQFYPQLIGDSAGGAFLVWQDNRHGADYDIFAQRVTSSGTLAWGQSGVPVCGATNHQYNPQLISDGAGGIIIVWQDKRSGQFDIYAQRINSLGQILWQTNGVPVATASGDQIDPRLTTDTQSGAFIAWTDYRSGTGFSDVYAQRVLHQGFRAWQTDGVPISLATNSQWNVQIVSDGIGGVHILWQDRRSGVFDNLFAQSVDNVGRVRWAENGIPLAPISGIQYYPQVAPDGLGGAVVAWQDNRRGADYDIYVQRFNPAGQLLWGSSGLPVCVANGHQYNPQITSQGSTYIITWQDRRRSNFDIYGQCVTSAGAPVWDLNGVAVAELPRDQIFPQLASDGANGAIIVWTDYQLGGVTTDLFAHRVGANGRPAGGCFRSISQHSFSVRAVRYWTRYRGISRMPNEGNVRDSVFRRGMFPYGLTVGVERLDARRRFSWILFTRGYYVRRALPQTGIPRALDRIYDRVLTGSMRNPSINRYNNSLSGELIALKLNIAASDAGILPAGFGDLILLDTSAGANPLRNLKLRAVAARVDSYMTYWRTQETDYTKMRDWLRRVNTAFEGVFDTLSGSPLRLTSVKQLFSVPFLVPAVQSPTSVTIPSTDYQYEEQEPTAFELLQNYPNPFNPFTTIEFVLPEPAIVTLRVYNIVGQEVAVLAEREYMEDGYQIFDFDAAGLSSGIYFYHLLAEEPGKGGILTSQVKKMMLLK